jgi:hypothetical protein
MVSMDSIVESCKLIPFVNLVKDYNVSVDMVLTNIFDFSASKQLEYHEQIIVSATHLEKDIKSMIHATLEKILTEWRAKILALWGIIFEYNYKPIWTLQVPTSRNNIGQSMVMVIDLDHLQYDFFNPNKMCC